MNRTRLHHLFDMDGRVVVITGGTRGIGRALAEGFVCAGAKVVVVGQNAASCEETEGHLRTLGGEALGISADVACLGDVAAIVVRTVRAYGGIDVVVNNAGVGPKQAIGHYTPDDWQHVFDVNVRGPVFLIQEALPHLKISGRAAVLNILSVAAFFDSRFFSIYGSSKAALLAHTRAAAAELARFGIRVNGIAPGPFDTDLSRTQTDMRLLAKTNLMKRVAEPDEAIGAALLLTSDAGSFITGQVLMVDGGLVVAR